MLVLGRSMICYDSNCYAIKHSYPLAVPVTPCHPMRPKSCCPVPVWWRSHAYTERAAGYGGTYCYGISTRFHHDDADMGHSIERAERVHLNSVLAHS